jgi:hypothetical protein
LLQSFSYLKYLIKTNHTFYALPPAKRYKELLLGAKLRHFGSTTGQKPPKIKKKKALMTHFATIRPKKVSICKQMRRICLQIDISNQNIYELTAQ